MVSKQKVLFVCTLNDFRSRVAGSLINKMAAKYFITYSAVSHPGRVHTNAIAAMKKIKVNISNHISNWIFEYLNTGIDIIISVRDDEKLSCPIFPKKL
tara:strand:- start:228 stop:521 length:294 start_codon:yes stop_codon:yes gene_type:complete